MALLHQKTYKHDRVPDPGVDLTTVAEAESLSFEVIEHEEALRALRLDWDKLYLQQNSRSSEQNFLRALAAWETICRPKGRKLFVIVGRAAGEIVLIFPLSVQVIGPIRMARGLGPEFFECHDVLIRPAGHHERWVASAWNYAASQVDLLRFPAVRTTAHIWPHVERAQAARWDSIAAPYVDCREWTGWEDYLRSRSTRFKQDCRKSFRLLKEAGDLQRIVVDSQDRLSETLEWMFAQKLAWLARRGKETRILLSKKPFYLAVCRGALEAGELVLIELVVNQQRVAAQFAFRARKRLQCEMIAWDDAWKKCGPGRALAVETLRWAFDNSCDIVDLGVFEHEFKSRFTDKAVTTGFHVFVPSGPRGRVLIAAREFRRALMDSINRAKDLFTKAALKRHARSSAKRSDRP